MTKLVTAVAVMKLVESKAVDLDAPVARYLTELPDGFGITVRNLLTHRPGLPDREVDNLVAYGEEKMPPLEEVLTRYLADLQKLDFEPGTRSAYSNWNYLTLGLIVERVAGMPYESFVTQSILRPLGMEHTVFRFADEPAGTSVASPIIATEAEPALRAVLSTNRAALDAEKIAASRSGWSHVPYRLRHPGPVGGAHRPRRRADPVPGPAPGHLGSNGIAGPVVEDTRFHAQGAARQGRSTPGVGTRVGGA